MNTAQSDALISEELNAPGEVVELEVFKVKAGWGWRRRADVAESEQNSPTDQWSSLHLTDSLIRSAIRDALQKLGYQVNLETLSLYGYGTSREELSEFQGHIDVRDGSDVTAAQEAETVG